MTFEELEAHAAEEVAAWPALTGRQRGLVAAVFAAAHQQDAA